MRSPGTVYNATRETATKTQHSQKLINKKNENLQNGEKIFANDVTDKGLISKIHKRWAEDFNRHFSKADMTDSQ